MSKREPAVSVVMAVHNGQRYVREAIDSVLRQTREDFELLIVDDGSTDDTPRILADYARTDPRMAVHRVSHRGRSAALNFGCAQARAELIARLDDDDVALPERLERQLHFLERHEDVALLGGGALLIDDKGRVFARDEVPTSDAEIRQTLEHSSPFYHPNVVIRRRAVEAVGGYRTAFEPAEDYDLWLRLAEYYALGNLPGFVGMYRMYPEQESVVFAEAAALRALAARESASDRREGRADRFATLECIDAHALAEAGVDQRELTAAVVHHAIWLAETFARAGGSSTASSLWDLAFSRAHSPSGTPELRDETNRRAAASRGSRDA
jgi:glycosyltransferase involved in cell wall biosynthesis